MEYKKITTICLQAAALALLITKSGYAEDVKVIGSIEHTLNQLRADSSARSNNSNSKKVIQLLRIQLSLEEKALLAKRAKDALTHTNQFSLTTPRSVNLPLPSKVQLGMNKVPVLDQGMHGTCVTFAVTGALDAVMAKGDYISQVCNLQLGTYLEKHGYSVSGWDGSYATTVINQIEQYGIVNTKKQRAYGCGGLTQYPAYSDHNPDSFIEPEKYRSMSELVFGQVVNWSDIYQKSDSNKTLNAVKEALHSGDRMAFATMLPRIDLGTAGAVGKHKTWIYKDTWVLTPEILKGLDDIEAAHEMIITGYDDNAVAVDDHGKKHKGLLTLRNSWGSSVGDYGEFYMSYDYFKLLAFDVTRFSPSSI
ncbi:C1 family peptidase [Legionella brunensis]|uniref:Cysteine protease n=1 Tax=Legionella brunensis TaxID=29422 RepID=A0A0W0S0W6_9GAMM|nr:C1 family peptidase [Legionella brunensis]KTC77100.1 cysteine protease [Legionella brunensis]